MWNAHSTLPLLLIHRHKHCLSFVIHEQQQRLRAAGLHRRLEVRHAVDGLTVHFLNDIAYMKSRFGCRTAVFDVGDYHSLCAGRKLQMLSQFRGQFRYGDAETWSGLAKLRDAFEAVRPRLLAFHDEKGRELFDLPRAPRPPAETAAPVRFLPDYDNLLLGHADRTRVVPATHRAKLATTNLRVMATFLVDGFVAGAWRISRARTAAALELEPFEPLSRKARAELSTEGAGLLRFAEPDARTFEVR